MTPDPIQPALTPEEWRLHLQDGTDDVDAAIEYASRKIGETIMSNGPNRHGLAALCLYQKPYGFTRQDVQWLRGYAKHLHYLAIGITGNPATEATPAQRGANRQQSEFWTSLADRIASLLPPSDSEAP